MVSPRVFSPSEMDRDTPDTSDHSPDEHDGVVKSTTVNYLAPTSSHDIPEYLQLEVVGDFDNGDITDGGNRLPSGPAAEAEFNGQADFNVDALITTLDDGAYHQADANVHYELPSSMMPAQAKPMADQRAPCELTTQPIIVDQSFVEPLTKDSFVISNEANVGVSETSFELATETLPNGSAQGDSTNQPKRKRGRPRVHQEVKQESSSIPLPPPPPRSPAGPTTTPGPKRGPKPGPKPGRKPGPSAKTGTTTKTGTTMKTGAVTKPGIRKKPGPKPKSTPKVSLTARVSSPPSTRSLTPEPSATAYAPSTPLSSLQKELHGKLQPLVSSTPDASLSEADIENELENRYLDVKDLVNNDLTHNAIVATFDDLPVPSVIKHIQQKFDNVKFTHGEKEVLKQFIKRDGLDADMNSEVIAYLPFRTEQAIHDKYRELQFNAGRPKSFKNRTEALVYEAKWMVLSSPDSGGRGSRASRRAKRVAELDAMQREAAAIKKPSKPQLSPEEEAEAERQRQERKAAREAREAKLAAEKEAARLKREQARLQTPKKPAAPKRNMELKYLLAGNDHFASIIGDGKAVTEGQKRKRAATKMWVPEFPNKVAKGPQLRRQRRQEAAAAEQDFDGSVNDGDELTSSSKAKTKPKNYKSKSRSLTPPLMSEKPIRPKKSTPTPSPSPEPESSPFDPIDIEHDTALPIHGRQVFVPEVYENKPLPKLMYDTSLSGINDLCSPGESVPLVDDSAVAICMSHPRNYRNPPPGFPPFFGDDDTPGVSPAVEIRFLLYPQHRESFKLCVPKSNELDPVYEIVRLWQIHYAMYFAHSDYIRYEIVHLCRELDEAFAQSDFAQFLFVIDKWNELMLLLSPNRAAVREIEASGQTDVNFKVRQQFLAPCERKKVTQEDLRLHMWISEIMGEPLSPAFEPTIDSIVEATQKTTITDGTTDNTSNGTSNGDSNGTSNGKLHSEANEGTVSNGGGDSTIGGKAGLGSVDVVKSSQYVIPKELYACMYERLQEKTSWSRFASQMILLRVYARVVSPNSRKLRAYKSFTAEVYGELLPSFTSEVLQKVGLKPNQKFYDLGSGVGNTAFQASLEFGAIIAGGCELMPHASKLTILQENMLRRHLKLFGLKQPKFKWALSQSFVDNAPVEEFCRDCEVVIVNNYLFDVNLNAEVGRLLRDLRPGTKIISLRNFILPRYRATGDSVFDKLKVEEHEMSYEMSVSWTASKVPYFVSTVQDHILPEYLSA